MPETLATELLRDMKHKVRKLVIAVIALVCMEITTLIGLICYANKNSSEKNSGYIDLLKDDEIVKSLQVTEATGVEGIKIRKDDESWLKNLDLQ